MAEQNLEDITEDNYRGLVDKFYKTIRNGIAKIPGRYSRGFVRGIISYPFAISGFVQLTPTLFKKLCKKKKFPPEEELYGLFPLLMYDARKERVPREHHINKVADTLFFIDGILVSTVGALYLTGYHGPSAIYQVLGGAAVLDAANYLEQRIREWYTNRSDTNQPNATPH